MLSPYLNNLLLGKVISDKVAQINYYTRSGRKGNLFVAKNIKQKKRNRLRMQKHSRKMNRVS